MSKFLYTLIAGSLLVGCQHSIVEPMHAIPVVDIRVEPTNAQAGKSIVTPDTHRVLLYPQFDYPAETITLDAADNAAQVALLPGTYLTMVHNWPIAPLVVSGTESIETYSVGLPANAQGNLPSCPMLYTLKAADPMKSVEVVRADNSGTNLLVFKSMLVTKRIQVEVNTSQFGNITSVRGTLTGVASALNLHTLKTTMGQAIILDKVTVKGNKLTFDVFDVLGFTVEKPDEVVLTIFVKNDEVDFELEQPVDLTDEIKKLPKEGGNVTIEIDLAFQPDIRVHPVTIRQWDESGNELEIGIN